MVLDLSNRADSASREGKRTPDAGNCLVHIALLLSCVLYCISFFLPAIQILRAHAESGWEAFLVVPKRLLESPPLQNWELLIVLLWWLPNPAFWIGIILLATQRWRAASIAGIIGLGGVVACGFELD